MNTPDLSALFSEATRIVADAGNLPTALTSFAHVLKRCLDVKAVQIRVRELGTSDAPAQHPVVGYDAYFPPSTDNETNQLHKTCAILEQDLSVTALRLIRTRVLRGPIVLEDRSLGPDECLLGVSVPLDRGAAWVVLLGDAALASEQLQVTLYQATTTLVEWLVEYFCTTDRDVAHERRMVFYSSLLSVGSSSPKVDALRLCRAWMELSGATWVWLWLYNRDTGHWELTAAWPTTEGRYTPDTLVAPSLNNVAELCNQLSRSVYIDDLASWNATLDAVDYRVATAESLRRLGCMAFDCIPLLGAVSPANADAVTAPRPGLRAALCLHYSHTEQRLRQPNSGFVLLGRFSSLLLTSSYETEQRAILLELNSLASTFLAKVSTRPEEVRRDYLAALISLVKRYLHVTYVSVFYRDPIEDKVCCIASTGLYNGESGETLSQGQLTQAWYSAGEGRTGKCFQSGQPYIARINNAESHKPKWRETNPSTVNPSSVSWMQYPIPCSDTRDRKAAGVIRCTCSEFELFPNRSRDFDSVQLQTLTFIAQQIAPVLEAMDLGIRREQAIQIIKHDLFAPLRMIEDTAEEIVGDFQATRSTNPYNIENLRVAVLLAKNLVNQLDINPAEVRNYDPIPTYLEGDIVARVKHMLAHFALCTNKMTMWFGSFENVIPRLYLDRALIERALCNLILNAIKYGRRGTRITVEPRSVPAGFYVDVANYGIGIEPAEEPFLFRGNYRSPRAKKVQQGLGLGLKIAKAAMERHGGRLEVVARAEPTVISMFFPSMLARTKHP